jgi:hypothetical protein
MSALKPVMALLQVLDGAENTKHKISRESNSGSSQPERSGAVCQKSSWRSRPPKHLCLSTGKNSTNNRAPPACWLPAGEPTAWLHCKPQIKMKRFWTSAEPSVPPIQTGLRHWLNHWCEVSIFWGTGGGRQRSPIERGTK